jgi:hypothetical protein
MLLALYLSVRQFATEVIARRAVWMLGTSLSFLLAGQYVNHDMLVAAWIGVAIWCFALAFMHGNKPHAGLARWGFVACALGVLSKGMIGLALPGLVLLVVPGRDWKPLQVAQLAHWQRQGMELAGHGWSHRAERIGTLYHRWHARFISRQAAEHMSLPRPALRQLLTDTHRWFEHHRLAPPELYVPPAWALGALRREDLAASAFRYFETTSGLYDVVSGARKHLPLMGFEADTVEHRFEILNGRRTGDAAS